MAPSSGVESAYATARRAMSWLEPLVEPEVARPPAQLEGCSGETKTMAPASSLEAQPIDHIVALSTNESYGDQWKRVRKRKQLLIERSEASERASEHVRCRRRRRR